MVVAIRWSDGDDTAECLIRIIEPTPLFDALAREFRIRLCRAHL